MKNVTKNSIVEILVTEKIEKAIKKYLNFMINIYPKTVNLITTYFQT